MKQTFFTTLLILWGFTNSFCQNDNPTVITDDIDNFWAAFDKIKTTNDTTEQLAYLNDLFLKKGTEGLSLIMQARHYTPQEYLRAIRKYPLFWASIRANTYKSKGFATEIAQGIEQLRVIYPELKPAKIYFTIGALRTGGTALNGQILIGSEIAMADSLTDVSEFTTAFANLKPHFATNPIKNTVFTNIHEYIHTQQNVLWGYDLLSQSLFEGIAEFIPTIATGKASTAPCVPFGFANNTKIRDAFEKDMFSPLFDKWIWDFNETFQMRDLGYYVGFAIAKKYYDAAADKKQAIKALIELDFKDPKAIETFAEKTGYFSRPFKKIKKEFERSRPTVLKIEEFKNGATNVSPALAQITVVFSEALDKDYYGAVFGKLGKDAFPEITSRSFSVDKKTYTYYVKLKPNQRYQFVVESEFRTEKGVPLKPFVVEFMTEK